MLRRTLLVGICALLTANAATATRVRRLSLTEIRDAASAVLVIDVLDSAPRLGEAKMVWTDYRVRVVEAIRGNRRAGDIIVLPFAGGRIGRIEAGVAGVQPLTIGGRYAIFVDDTPCRPVPAVGWGQGLFRVENDGGVEKLISESGEPLVVDSAGNFSARHAGGSAIAHRLAEPLAVNADGSPALRLYTVNGAAKSARRTATLEDFRRFVHGEESR